LGTFRKACYDSFIGRNGIIQRKIDNPMWKTYQATYDYQWNFDKEDFEIIKFIEDNAPFTMLLGKPWIERDQARRKEEEEVLDRRSKS
jgi:hypothetical protein